MPLPLSQRMKSKESWASKMEGKRENDMGRESAADNEIAKETERDM